MRRAVRLASSAVCAVWLAASAGCLPTRAGERLAHFEHEAPAVGDPAPDFDLETVDGVRVRLRDLVGERPVVIVFGNLSCPAFRYRRFELRPLFRELATLATFAVVYNIETHPVGSECPYTGEEWVTWTNRLTGNTYAQPTTAEERRSLARVARDELDLVTPVLLVDDMTNSTWRSYGRASNPAFVIDLAGRIAHAEPWATAAGIRAALEALVDDDGTLAR